MAAPILLAVAGGGAAMKAYGQWKAAEAQANAKREQASLLDMEAGEILARTDINNDLLAQDAIRFSGRQAASMAASGGGVSATSSAILEETARLASEEMGRNLREAKWEAHMKNIEADSMRRSADQFEKAGKIAAIGSILGSGAKIAGSKPG